MQIQKVHYVKIIFILEYTESAQFMQGFYTLAWNGTYYASGRKINGLCCRIYFKA